MEGKDLSQVPLETIADLLEVLRDEDNELANGEQIITVHSTWTDDHIACCAIAFRGVAINFWWCGPELAAAVRYIDSARARQDLIERIVGELFEGSFFDEWCEITDNVKGLSLAQLEELTVMDVVKDHLESLYKSCREVYSHEEMLTHYSEWIRQLAKRFTPEVI